DIRWEDSLSTLIKNKKDLKCYANEPFFSSSIKSCFIIKVARSFEDDENKHKTTNLIVIS
ncbi:unnamed protein product, partial [Prunus brigantina]